MADQAGPQVRHSHRAQTRGRRWGLRRRRPEASEDGLGPDLATVELPGRRSRAVSPDDLVLRSFHLTEGF